MRPDLHELVVIKQKRRYFGYRKVAKGVVVETSEVYDAGGRRTLHVAVDLGPAPSNIMNMITVQGPGAQAEEPAL